MNIKKLFILAAMPMMCLALHAQESKGEVTDYTPKKGNFTVAATVGYNSYTSISAPSGSLTTYELQAVSTSWNDKKLMVGFEAGWFFKDLWKLSLSGGISFTHNPGYAEVPGTIDSTNVNNSVEDNMGEIPNYRAVANAQSFAYNVAVGVDRYFKCTKVPRLMWYMGVRVGFAYAENETKYDETTSMGKSVAEAWNLRGSITCGIDYFVLPAMYVGAQIDPFSYTYNMTSVKPQPGLKRLSADSHNFSGFAAPTIKIGFKF